MGQDTSYKVTKEWTHFLLFIYFVLFFNSFISFYSFIYLYVGVGGRHARVPYIKKQRSEGTLGTFLAEANCLLCHVGSRPGTQFFRPGSMCLYLLSHLTNLTIIILFLFHETSLTFQTDFVIDFVAEDDF